MRRPGHAQRATNSGGQASPPTISRRSDGRSRSNSESVVGTHEKTVTSWSARWSASNGPEVTCSRVPLTKQAPAAKASQISSTEASKASEKPCHTRSCAVTP